MLLSKCACITPDGRLCSPSDIGTLRSCKQYKQLEEYFNELSPISCDRYEPLYTVIYQQDELEEMTIEQLKALYRYYNLDKPTFRAPTILSGHVAGASGVTALQDVYETLHEHLPYKSKELTEKELLVRGLMYYYCLVAKYGMRRRLLQPTVCSNDIPNTVRTMAPVTDFSPTKIYTDQKLSDFIHDTFEWFVEQAEQLLLFENAIQGYIAADYTRMNKTCRTSQSIKFDAESKLLHAFTIASPLPRDLLVYRYLSDFSYSTTDVSIEKGFMSVSIAHRDRKDRAKKNIKHYLQLFVPKGTVCLNFLLYNINEYELVLPPYTTFKVYKTKKVDDTEMYYAYICA